MIVGSAVALITIVSIGADTAYFLTTHHLFPFTHVIGSVKAHPNPQAVLQATLLHDDNALDQGVLSYPRSGALTTGDRKRLDVTVEDIGRHPHATLSVAEASRKSGRIVFPEDVPTGGIVSLRMTSCSSNLTCSPLSAGSRVAIVGKGSSASWSWEITANSPGPASVILSAATYAGTSAVILRRENITVSLEVRATPAYSQAQAALNHHHELNRASGILNGVNTAIAGTAASLAAIGTAIIWLAKRAKRNSKKKQKKAKPKAKV